MEKTWSKNALNHFVNLLFFSFIALGCISGKLKIFDFMFSFSLLFNGKPGHWGPTLPIFMENSIIIIILNHPLPLLLLDNW